jgi:CRISPR-associated endoribonuclease Cas6
MRITVIFQVKKGEAIPVNYQWELSSALYRIIEKADRDYSTFLHSKGYQIQHRQFKMFCFSQLEAKMLFQNNTLIFQEEQARLELGFFVDELAENFIQGIFQRQAFSLGNNYSKAHLTVSQVLVNPKPNIKEKMTFKACSPLVISVPNQRGHADYLSPDDERYAALLKHNLLLKWETAQKPNNEDILKVQHTDFYFELASEAKSKLITIKSQTTQETKVRGFVYKFHLQAHPALIETGLMAGFGEKNAQGFGFVREF